MEFEKYFDSLPLDRFGRKIWDPAEVAHHFGATRMVVRPTMIDSDEVWRFPSGECVRIATPKQLEYSARLL